MAKRLCPLALILVTAIPAFGATTAAQGVDTRPDDAVS